MALTINRRYQVRKELTNGDSRSRVLLVEDVLLGRRAFALKLLSVSPDHDLARARREFETLRRLRHPLIAEVYDFGRVEEIDGAAPAGESARPILGDFFITFSYIDGLDLRDAFLRLFPEAAGGAGVDPSGLEIEGRWKVLYGALADVALGLHAIHSHGLLHHDIKPQNLLLVPQGGSPIPERFEVKIIDLGLAESETTPLGNRVRGTLPFISREVLSGAFADQRSDLYSLGISIIWAITGRLPFPGTTPQELTEAIQSTKPLDVPRLLASAPEGLRRLVARLVHPEPRERPPDALALVDELERLGGSSSRSPVHSFRADVPRIGWERELSLLAGEIEALSFGESERSLVMVETDPGHFVEQLLDEVEAAAKLHGARCFSGRARTPAQYPYQAVTEILLKLLDRIDVSQERYRKFRPWLAYLVPSLADGVPPPGSCRDVVQARWWLFDGITEFLLEASREAPTVLIIRNLGRCEGETIDLIEFIARNVALRRRGAEEEEAPPRGTETDAESSSPRAAEPIRLLVLAEFEETPASHSGGGMGATAPAAAAAFERIADLASQSFALKVKLRPLGQERVGEWLHRRLPGISLSGKLLQKIQDKCGGSPRLLDEIARRLSNLLDGRQRDEGLASVHFPEDAHEAALERLLRMEGDRSILDLLAVAHGPLSVSELERLRLRADGATDPDAAGSGSAFDQTAALPSIRRWVEEGFLRFVDGRGEIEVAWSEEALRDLYERQLPEERCSACHRLLLETHLQDPPEDFRFPEVAAFHAARCGKAEVHFRAALQAARRCQRSRAPDSAIRLLEDVTAGLGMGTDVVPRDPSGPSPDELRWTVHQELADLHHQKKNYSRAIEKYTVLLSLDDRRTAGVGGDPLRRARIYREMGKVYGENKDPSNALYFLEKSLDLLGSCPPGPDSVEGLQAMAEFHLGRGQYQQAESAARQALGLIESVASPPSLQSRVHGLLGSIAARQNDTARSLAWHLQALALVQEGGDLARTLEALGAVGEVYLARGEYDKALEHLNRGVEVARRTGCKLTLSLFLNQIGTIHFNRAHHDQALECFRDALRLRREIGDVKGIANSYNNLGLVYRLRDDLRQAALCYRKSIDLFSRIDDEYGMAAGMNNLANILELEGKYNEALDYSYRSLEKRKRFNSRSGIAFSYYRIGKIYQSKGELDKALNFAEKSLSIRREIGDRMGAGYSHVQLAELYFLSGRISEALQEYERGEQGFKSLENSLGLLVAREILSRILIQAGVYDEAASILNEALAEARRGNQQLIVGSALLHLGRISMEHGRLREAEGHLSRAETLFRENRNRRDHAEVLLERCALTLDLGHHERASEILEEAYGTLEELGIRDLVPRYFLLRGRIEAEMAGGSQDRARKFLERGLVEAREVNLPDLTWQLHFRLAVLLQRREELVQARVHMSEAESILQEEFKLLPAKFQERFFQTRDRRDLQKLSEQLSQARGAAGPPEAEAAPPAAVAEPAAAGDQIERIRTLNHKLLKLQEVSQVISSELNLNLLLEKLVDAVLELMNAERGCVILRSANGDGDEVTVARNIDREAIKQPEMKISRSIPAEVMRTGRPALHTSAIEEERFSASKSIQNLRLRSILCVPILSRGEVLGAIYLDNRLRKHAFDEGDQNVLETLSAQAAIAITNARLSEVNQRRSRDLAEKNVQLNELGRRLLNQVNEQTEELKQAREDLRRKENEDADTNRFHQLVGKSKRMREIFRILPRVADTVLPVLITGESGTGKELVARAIHQSSSRRDQRFISENCGALSETLLESELFGHVRGAFTGAVAERKGLFEIANGSHLFLDEVGDMSLAMQKKLLRVLEEGMIRRVGGKDTIAVDTRIISASNQNLKTMVDQGKFREDLFYRLNGICIEMPSLRDRKEDIPPLTQHFLNEIARDSRQPPKTIHPDALRLLIAHDWPGNVRELRHFLERTVLLSASCIIEAGDCGFDSAPIGRDPSAHPPGLVDSVHRMPLRSARDQFVQKYLEVVFEANDRNVSRASRAAGISRESFHRLLKKFRQGSEN